MLTITILGATAGGHIALSFWQNGQTDLIYSTIKSLDRLRVLKVDRYDPKNLAMWRNMVEFPKGFEPVWLRASGVRGIYITKLRGVKRENAVKWALVEDEKSELFKVHETVDTLLFMKMQDTPATTISEVRIKLERLDADQDWCDDLIKDLRALEVSA